MVKSKQKLCLLANGVLGEHCYKKSGRGESSEKFDHKRSRKLYRKDYEEDKWLRELISWVITEVN